MIKLIIGFLIGMALTPMIINHLPFKPKTYNAMKKAEFDGHHFYGIVIAQDIKTGDTQFSWYGINNNYAITLLDQMRGIIMQQNAGKK